MNSDRAFIRRHQEEDQSCRPQPIDPATIVRVYSGRPGCGCGCQGTYWEDAHNIRRVAAAMNRRLDEVRVTSQPPIYSVEGERRYYWAYGKGA